MQPQAQLSLIPISDPQDPRLDGYMRIRERDLVGRRGRFIVEGEVALEVMIRRGVYPVESVFISEKRQKALTPLLASLTLQRPEAPIYVAPQALMNELVGFAIHRGVLAIGRKGQQEPLEDFLNAAGSRPLVLLAGLTNHDNVGGLFRNAAAFDAHVLLDDRCCDPHYRKAIRVSSGTSLYVPFWRSDAPAAKLFEELRSRGYAICALTPRPEAAEFGPDWLAQSAAPKQVWVLGTEGPGLSEELLASADIQVQIPMAPGIDSLNVATSGAIVLAQLFSHRKTSAIPTAAPG